ncbi:MAG: ribosome maturation factor RimP [bacterium]
MDPILSEKIGVFFLVEMEQRQLQEKLWAMLEPIVVSHDLQLVEIEFQREPRGWVLRLYIDRKEGGVSLNDCALVSREVGDLLDAKDPIDHPYRLEVSSPGPQRPLRKPEDFQRWCGHRVKVKPWGGNRKFLQGILLGLQDGVLELQTSGEIQRIPLSEIARARLLD